MRLLVTAGATREPLDEVRFVSNVSSGATGAALADGLLALGHDVALLRGESAARPQHVHDCETFSSCADLLAKLQRRLAAGGFDAVVMTAAVADYRPDLAQAGKIRSDADELVVRLVRNPKILPQLKAMSPRALRVVGFKFTVAADAEAAREAVAAQWAAGGVDLTVHNDLHEIRSAALHPFHLYRDPLNTPRRVAGVPALVDALHEFLQKS
ncbi:MAG TPA: phosphopantothenoylcysteine decarboxylase [Opitutaceae bacterium]|nr:phosphopantothenoylcysteine decarboxylase [Opitutaceae bacterium]